ncbi:MAG: LD-carboxypeptidase [Saprospiraceae bacterium]|nr:LD-carboxypeptidase [Saprospiraceae bacterium]
MNRRSFTQTLVGSGLWWTAEESNRTKPIAYLKPGDRIGLICPSGPISQERLERSLSNMDQLGLVPVLGKHIMQQNGYLAGNQNERLEDLHNMYADLTVKAIWCIRGGFGATHLLPYLDYKLIKKHPKVLLGYSDITALHCALSTRLAFSNFHSPVASSEMTPYTLEQLRNIIFGTSGQLVKIGTSQENDDFIGEGKTVFERYVISPGQAHGILWGGNLSLLAALCGTPYLKVNRDFLLFLEDIEEAPYRIDRMITQLLQVLPLHLLKGIVLGVFEGCEKKADTASQTLKEMMIDKFSHLSIPVVYGFPFGHILHQCTLPFGAEAILDTESFSLTVKLP